MTLPEAFALDVPCDDTIPVIERLTHGRAATVAALRALADALDGLPLADAAEPLLLLGPRLDDLAAVGA